ncbi:hypothetical protein SSS_02949 [Sarcoptes scabiei]|uniref:Uncharacterized protein n=1 Tax=Sarcoptes scabiei TaxID=52283 RepID=A0A834V8N9_SARSC|nr:hypothetical protein SSS_02949 [Sarcoptes scabiei]
MNLSKVVSEIQQISLTKENSIFFSNSLRSAFNLIYSFESDVILEENIESIQCFLDLILLKIWPNKRIGHLEIKIDLLKHFIEIIDDFLIRFLTKFKQPLSNNTTSSIKTIDTVWKFLFVSEFLLSDSYENKNNRDSVHQKLSNLLFDITNYKSYEEFLSKSKVKYFLDCIKSHKDDCEEWPSIFGNSIIFQFIVFHINYSNLHEYVFDLFPMVLRIIDNHLAQNQTIGLKCLNYILKHRNDTKHESSCFHILFEYGYHDLIYLKTKNSLLNPEIDSLELIYENLNLLFQTENHVESNCSDSEVLKKIFVICDKKSDILIHIADNFRFHDSEHFLEAQLRVFLKHILPIMDCHLLRIAKIYIETSHYLLDKMLIYCSEDLSLLILEFLEKIFCCLNLYLKRDDLNVLVVKLFKIDLKLNAENMKWKDKIGRKIFDILESLKQTSKDQNKEFIETFINRILQSKLLEQS